MSPQENPWAVETAQGNTIFFDKEKAYRHAEMKQQDGQTVEIYYHGKLESRLKGSKQYSFVV